MVGLSEQGAGLGQGVGGIVEAQAAARVAVGDDQCLPGGALDVDQSFAGRRADAAREGQRCRKQRAVPPKRPVRRGRQTGYVGCLRSLNTGTKPPVSMPR
jgi:hypothetical protein